MSRPLSMRPVRDARRNALSPALRHYLMCGATSAAHMAPARLPGWFDVLFLKDGALAAAWAAHRDQLSREARAAGFSPVAARWFTGGDVDDVPPTDHNPARAAWSMAFCRQHGY